MTPVSVPSRAGMMPGSDRRSRAKTKRSKAARVGAEQKLARGDQAAGDDHELGVVERDERGDPDAEPVAQFREELVCVGVALAGGAEDGLAGDISVPGQAGDASCQGWRLRLRGRADPALCRMPSLPGSRWRRIRTGVRGRG